MPPLLALLLLAPAAERTTLVLDAPVPPEPRYSQSISVVAHLARESDGSAVAGADCQAFGGAPCSVIISVAPADDPGAAVVVNAQGFVTDTEGATSGAHVLFVDGVPDQATHYAAATDGAPYVIRARFLGAGAGAAAGNPDCAPDAAETGGAGLCPSEATVDVSLFSETSSVVLGEGLEANLGDTLTLSANVFDPNGDSDGSDVDGPGPKNLVGVDVTFFYDVDNNGHASADEAIGTAPTNAAGVASTDFTLDPQFIRAGTYDSGIQAEYSGDDHFGVARASVRIVVHPAGIDVSRTVIEADPDTIPADGFSSSELRVRLVDTFNNPLDENSDPHDVSLSTTLGVLNGTVERDLLNGTYTQVLQAQRKGGTATVTVTVDGEEGPSRTVEIVGGTGCHCGSVDDVPGISLALACLAAIRLRLRRRRRARRGWRGARQRAH